MVTTKVWFVGKKYKYGIKTYKTKSKASIVARKKHRKYVGFIQTKTIKRKK